MRRKIFYSNGDEQFLLARLEEDWRMAERALKRHEIARRAKEAGTVLGKTVLACALLAGVLTVAAVAPNAFGVVGKALLGKRYFGKREFEEQLPTLKKRGYVRAEKTKDGRYRLTLTEHGRKYAISEIHANLKVRERAKWDGTWWLVMFDIPRRYNAGRNALRERLRALGLMPLQASVFASKYPCADEVWFTARLFGLEKFVAVAHMDAIEGFGERLERITKA